MGVEVLECQGWSGVVVPTVVRRGHGDWLDRTPMHVQRRLGWHGDHC
jgi:hypothetical protein